MNTVKMNHASSQIVDFIIEKRLIVARLGESPRKRWWNVDATDVQGGSSVLHRILGKQENDRFHWLCSGEAILQAARMFELQKRGTTAHSIKASLFQLEPADEEMIQFRWFHYKKYPDNVPEFIYAILNPNSPEQGIDAQRIAEHIHSEYERTEDGHRIVRQPGLLETVNRMFGAIDFSASEYIPVYYS